MIEHLLNELTIVSTQLKFQSFFNEVRFGWVLGGGNTGLHNGQHGMFQKGTWGQQQTTCKENHALFIWTWGCKQQN